MDNINGIEISSLPFELNKLVGVLLFHEYPTTIVYSLENKRPVIKEWVDCNEDNSIDRYFIYEITREILKDFLDGIINHQEMITSGLMHIGYLVDQKNSRLETIKVVSPLDLPFEYIPNHDSYFDIDEGVDTQKIITEFDLESCKHIEPLMEKPLIDLATVRKSELFNLHLPVGKGIGVGVIKTRILGQALLSFENLFQEVSLDHYLGKNRGEIKLKAKDKEHFLDLSSTQVVAQEAASYSIFIRPKVSTYDLLEGVTNTEAIARNIFDIFESTSDLQNLKQSYNNNSDFVYHRYRIFLEELVQLDLKIDLNWYNPMNRSLLKRSLNLYFANQMLNNLDELQTESEESFSTKGKFRAINCNTGYYTFMSIKDEEFNGYFDKLVKESMSLLTFRDIYEITINRKTKKEAGSVEPKITDTIIAHYLIKE